MSIRTKIQNLIAAANSATGESAEDLTGAVQDLIDGYGGGGGGGEITSGVKFIDYDGTVVESWDSASVASKTELPTNPTHTGLVAQGWNWSLANVKSYIAKYPEAIVCVGQMYKTASGLTEIDITVLGGTGKTVTCRMSGRKNWGDGTTDTNTTHAYTDYGDYTITCEGTIIPSGTSSRGGMFDNSSTSHTRYWCTAIRIGDSVTSIGDYAFSDCCSLSSITIPDSVTSIGTHAFRKCYALTGITIPDSVTSIGTYAFNTCYSLASVTIPDSVTSIGTYAFQKCYALTGITIPDSVTSIGMYVFNTCYALTGITIPDSVTSIGTYAFSVCYSLASATIPGSVTSIDTYAFYQCYTLTSVTIENGVTSIGANAFNACYSLTSVIIPGSVTSIGNSAFSACYSFTSVTILGSVTSIGTGAFNSCYPVLKYDFSSSTSVPTLSDANAFSNINGICKIVVPDALYDTWIAATNWATYANHIYKASGVA